VGWYKELYEQCDDVDQYGFTARNAKTGAEYDTLIVQLRNPGSFRQYLAMNYYQRLFKGSKVEYVDLLTKKTDETVTYEYLSECAVENRLKSVPMVLMPYLAYGLKGVQHYQWKQTFKVWTLEHNIKPCEFGLVSNCGLLM
jgi:hypothetical protein